MLLGSNFLLQSHFQLLEQLGAGGGLCVAVHGEVVRGCGGGAEDGLHGRPRA